MSIIQMPAVNRPRPSSFEHWTPEQQEARIKEEQMGMHLEACPKCVPARRHPECSYCRGYSYTGLHTVREGQVCGVCRGNGIKGSVIRGTTLRRCHEHRRWGK